MADGQLGVEGSEVDRASASVPRVSLLQAVTARERKLGTYRPMTLAQEPGQFVMFRDTDVSESKVPRLACQECAERLIASMDLIFDLGEKVLGRRFGHSKVDKGPSDL